MCLSRSPHPIHHFPCCWRQRSGIIPHALSLASSSASQTSTQTHGLSLSSRLDPGPAASTTTSTAHPPDPRTRRSTSTAAAAVAETFLDLARPLGTVPYPGWRIYLVNNAHQAGMGGIGRPMEWVLRGRGNRTAEATFVDGKRGCAGRSFGFSFSGTRAGTGM